jgi:hypothetical protein
MLGKGTGPGTTHLVRFAKIFKAAKFERRPFMAGLCQTYEMEIGISSEGGIRISDDFKVSTNEQTP